MAVHFRLRDFTPRGLYARIVALLMLPVMIILALTTWYYYSNHIRTVNAKLSQSIAREASLITNYCANPARDPAVEVSLEDQLGLMIDCDHANDLSFPFDSQDRFSYDHVLRAELEDRGNYASDVRLIDNGSVLDIRKKLEAGQIVRILIDRKRALSVNTHFFIVWVILFSLLMLALAFAFLRNQVKSILRLSEAAKAFGRGRDMPGFKPSGATEVREAAHAMIDMKRRLTSFADQRTAMLAAVSHDLRTPLTRLKLELAMLDGKTDLSAAKADLDDMSAMLDEYLSFAKGEEGEAATEIQMADLAREVAEATGGDIKLGELTPCTVIGKPLAIKRALTNLVTNAVLYGEHAELSVIEGPHMAEFMIDDDGPGIAPEQYDDAFRPFTRLEEARTQNTPGTGLGLALALDTARAHGGDVRLEKSPMGGLRARLRLPH